MVLEHRNALSVGPERLHVLDCRKRLNADNLSPTKKSDAPIVDRVDVEKLSVFHHVRKSGEELIELAVVSVKTLGPPIPRPNTYTSLREILGDEAGTEVHHVVPRNVL